MLDDVIKLKQKIISKQFSFEEIALSIFQFQYKCNKIYRQFVDLSKTNIDGIKNIEQIPFLPIQFFKTHNIYSSDSKPEFYFESSGTTQTTQAKHFIYDMDWYKLSFVNGFYSFFGKPEEYTILALLPNYLERQHSSLVYMMNELILMSKSAHSGFFLHDFEALNQALQNAKHNNRKIILLGVTYALLDFANEYPQDLAHCIVVETGGMKGKRKEMTKQEVHAILKKAFGIQQVYAEYGMTELLSQAYSKQDGLYTCSHAMRVYGRDIYNPKQILELGKRGALNIVDLCNLYSCSFIATEDVGIIHSNTQFELLGRLDNSDVRGCNLMLD